jgi:hypothetical protein
MGANALGGIERQLEMTGLQNDDMRLVCLASHLHNGIRP